MIGTITGVYRGRYAIVSAPFISSDVYLARAALLTETPFNRQLIGQNVTFRLRTTPTGLKAWDAWLCSGDIASAASLNRRA